jgi:hypothetical protein
MKTFTITEDIKVHCLTATSFPAGLKAVYDRLHATYPPENGRTYYGISYPDGNGSIVYKAAVKLIQSDGDPGSGFEPFIIKKGDYIGEEIRDFMSDVQSIGRLFQQLIAQPGIAPDGYCLEIYLNPTDVRCLVKMAD